MNYDYETILIDIGNKYLKEILKYGYAKAGNNGAYYCADTPCRNSAHWCVTYAYLYGLTGVNEYKEAVVILAEYLLKAMNKTVNNTVCCMLDTKFDSINGLIGQAWVIEGLIYAAKCIKDDRYYEGAKKIFLSQNFVEQVGQWERIDTNGANLGYDIAFNHQLWFAASGAEICDYKNDETIRKMVDIFMEKCNEHFRIRKNGLIVHFGQREVTTLRKFFKRILLCIVGPLLVKYDPDRFGIDTYEASYQLFNLYGFAVIKDIFGDYSFFDSPDFKLALKCGMNIEYLNRLLHMKEQGRLIGKYSYAYNSPAFEYPYVAAVFDKDKIDSSIIEKLLDFQIQLFYSKDLKRFDRNTSDPETLTARIYEITRYLNKVVDKV